MTIEEIDARTDFLWAKLETELSKDEINVCLDEIARLASNRITLCLEAK